MDKLILIVLVAVIAVGAYVQVKSPVLNFTNPGVFQGTPTTTVAPNEQTFVTVMPISHASLILQWGDGVIYADPTGGNKAYDGKPSPTLILVTDIHGDHLNADTLTTVLGNATLIVPQAVKDALPENLAVKAKVLANGESTSEQGFTIQAIPMYNLPESSEAPHTKGRGNGYLIEKDGKRVYIAGDTAGTPEMKALSNIDVAFIPMNLPYTMSVEDAAQAVLAFKPKQVYPYHYRTQDGFSDINKFKELVYTGNPEITVTLGNWYPN